MRKIDDRVLTGIFGKGEVAVTESQSQVFTVQARGSLSKSSSQSVDVKMECFIYALNASDGSFKGFTP